MKLGNRMPVDLGVVLVAGLTMALAGCTGVLGGQHTEVKLRSGLWKPPGSGVVICGRRATGEV